MHSRRKLTEKLGCKCREADQNGFGVHGEDDWMLLQDFEVPVREVRI